MFKKKKFLRTVISGILLTGLVFTQPSMLCFAQADDQASAAATPIPDSHTEYYSQEPDSNQITGWPTGPNIEGEAGILMEVTTGTVLYAKNIDEKLYPASITKVMTALLACENLDLDSQLVMSEAAAHGIEAGSSSIYADTGEIFTVEQALMALMLESANEMALALGEETSGSVKKFVELMNERARQLGCTNTHFNNPNGLPDETHYTTAYDMALIARAAFLNPTVKRIMSTSYYEIPPTNVRDETVYCSNHHKMMAGKDYAYDGVIGGKTGYTVAAGNTLVTFAQRGNMALVSVVLQSVNGAYSDTAALLDYGFNQFERVSLGWNREPSVMQLPSEQHILNEEEDKASFYALRQACAVVPIGTDTTTLTSETTYLNGLAGLNRLQVRYFYNDHPVGIGIRYEKEILTNLLIK
jgi:D-alanyl-D-alanine carboxypeptidase (penicillin-binding protein 5/6)